MPTLEENLITELEAAAPVTALVGTRIFPVILPQNTTLPAITYQVVTTVLMPTLDGESGLENALFQIDCWAAGYAAAKDLAATVRTALLAATLFKAVRRGDRDGFEDRTKIYRIISDYSLWR